MIDGGRATGLTGVGAGSVLGYFKLAWRGPWSKKENSNQSRDLGGLEVTVVGAAEDGTVCVVTLVQVYEIQREEQACRLPTTNQSIITLFL